jgi:AICAR transformylase/IMP cyclohydrolase PurH
VTERRESDEAVREINEALRQSNATLSAIVENSPLAIAAFGKTARYDAAIFGWLAELSRDTYVNIMGQYHPCHRVGRTQYAKIDRRPTAAEMGEAYRLAREAGLWRFE